MKKEERSRDADGRYAKERATPPVTISERKPTPPAAPGESSRGVRTPKTLADIDLLGSLPRRRRRGKRALPAALTGHTGTSRSRGGLVNPSEQGYSVSERVSVAGRGGGAAIAFLAHDLNSEVRLAVAGNDDAAEDVLVFLGENDLDTMVLVAVAGHARTPAETLAAMGRRLSGPDRWAEKLALLGNPRFPRSEVLLLVDDPDPLVRARARDVLSLRTSR